MTGATKPSLAQAAVRGISERNFQRQVLDLAGVLGWRVYHTWLSVRSAPGFPDLVLCRAETDTTGRPIPGTGRLIFAELKSATGKPTPAQSEWLALLEAVPGVEAYLWRPHDLEGIARVLRCNRGQAAASVWGERP